MRAEVEPVAPAEIDAKPYFRLHQDRALFDTIPAATLAIRPGASDGIGL
jgi:hypothetical protein